MREIHVSIPRNEIRDVKRNVSKKSAIKLMGELNDTAFILYQYYVANSWRDNEEFEDKDAAEELGWSEDKVARTRRKLTKAHWFHQESGAYSGGRKIFTTYLGKENVLKVLGLREVSPWEIIALGGRVRDELGLSSDEYLESKEAKKLVRKYFAELERTRAPTGVVKSDEAA